MTDSVSSLPVSSLYDRAGETAAFLATQTALKPTVAVVLGSGLGGFASQLDDALTIPFSEIPHFVQSTAIGHAGRLVIGTVDGVPVAVMQGRFHSYEGYTSEEVTFPIRAFKRWGIRTLIVTNAAGGVRESYEQGQLVLISDHINLTGRNPVVGPNEDRFGLRFFDMSEAYSIELRRLAQAAALEEDFVLDEGIYMGLLGPSFETPAEIRAFRTLGADLVGMSTVQETIVARHMGIEVLGISCVTNMAAGMQAEPLDQYEVLEVGKRIEATLARLLIRVVPTIVRRG